MPLRVTKEYSIDEEKGQKVHRKMSKNGHYQKVRRPTNLEVYNDAAKILEELLEKRIDRSVKVTARQRRNQTDPTKQKELVDHRVSDVPVTRSKTMPSRYREVIEKNLRNKDEAETDRKEQKMLKKKAVMGNDTDSSSNETDLESDAENESYGVHRKKKSMFKRAKENLIRTFRRDQKDGLGKKEEIDVETSSFKRRKSKKKSDKEPVVSESKRSIKGRLNKDKSIDYTETVDFRKSDPSSQTDTYSHKIRSGSMSRNSLMNSIRNPFRKSLKKGTLEHDEKTRLHTEKGVRQLSLKDDGTSSHSPNSTTSPQHGSTTPSPTAPPPPPLVHSIHSQISDGKDAHKGGRGGTLSSTSSTIYPMSEYNNSAGSLNILPSIQSSVLDSPGEDIGFIDEEESEKRRSMMKYHGSEGLLSLQWLADQTANAKALDFEIDEHSVSTLRPDGHLETTTTVTATKTVVLPEVEEDDRERMADDPDGNGQDSQGPMKEQLYGKIAQKLIEMADIYGASLSEGEGREEALRQEAIAIADAPLTDLEKEIIACLRSGGDRYGKKMEDQLDAMRAAASDDAYDRFRSTLDNSMGHELSWNTLALLFYATKGVVSAVGKSSKVATQAKEFTLKYISDTFVSWIMEQGGFDSMLSGSETDPELD